MALSETDNVACHGHMHTYMHAYMHAQHAYPHALMHAHARSCTLACTGMHAADMGMHAHAHPNLASSNLSLSPIGNLWPTLHS
jgi:hypothetical protein